MVKEHSRPEQFLDQARIVACAGRGEVPVHQEGAGRQGRAEATPGEIGGMPSRKEGRRAKA